MITEESFYMISNGSSYWTGARWSKDPAEAKLYVGIDAADSASAHPRFTRLPKIVLERSHAV